MHILKIHIFTFGPLICFDYPHEEVNFLFLIHGPCQPDNSFSFILSSLRINFIFAVNGFGFGCACLNLALIRGFGKFVWAISAKVALSIAGETASFLALFFWIFFGRAYASFSTLIPRIGTGSVTIGLHHLRRYVGLPRFFSFRFPTL